MPGVPRRRDLLLAAVYAFRLHSANLAKVGHFIPELVVSSYSDTGNNPWGEMSALSAPTLLSQGGAT